MATQSKANPVTESIDAASERVVELNEKAVMNGKKAGAAALETYEKAVVSFTESYEKAAGATKVDWIATTATAQADLTASSSRRTRAPRAARLLTLLPTPARSRRCSSPGAAAVGKGACAPPMARRRPTRPHRPPAALGAAAPSTSGPPGWRYDRRLLIVVLAVSDRTPPPVLVQRVGRYLRGCARASNTFSEGSRRPRSICGEVRIRDAGQVRELPHRRLYRLALTADEGAEG